jgi:hypothetical protein
MLSFRSEALNCAHLDSGTGLPRGDPVKRRKFIALLGSATGWPLATHAQSPGKLPIIGFLGASPSIESVPYRGTGERSGATVVGPQRILRRDVGAVKGASIRRDCPQTVTTIGLDIVKSVFQVHGVDAAGQVPMRGQLKRRYLLSFRRRRWQCH